MYSGDFCFVGAASAPAGVSTPTKNSAAHPSATQTPLSSYPHVLPRRQGASPDDRTSVTPFEVLAAQWFRSPGFEVQVTVTGFAAGASAAGAPLWARTAPVVTAAQMTSVARRTAGWRRHFTCRPPGRAPRPDRSRARPRAA